MLSFASKHLWFFTVGVFFCLFGWGQDYEVSLNFCPQEKSKWCWAACVQSAASSFQKKFSQTEIVDLTLPKAQCKNVPGKVPMALHACNFECKQSPISLSKDEIESELAAERPVVIRVLKPTGLGHFVVIYGQQGDQYMIWDPAGGGKKLLLTRYQIKSRLGDWTHTISGIQPELRHQGPASLELGHQ